MFKRFRVSISMVLFMAAMVSGAARAGQRPREAPRAAPRSAQLRDAMQRYFETRLRADLELSDAQVRSLTPLVRDLEQRRSDALRDHAEASRALRRALERGDNDRELARLLEQMEQASARRWETESSLMPRVDAELTVRQRAQFRFFVQDFRREMQQKIREVRERRPPRRQQRRRP